MATVVELKPLMRMPSEPPPESAAQRRLRRGGRIIAWLFAGLFAAGAGLLTAMVLAMLFYRGDLIQAGPQNFYIGKGPPGSVVFSALPLVQRAVYAAVAIARTGPVLMIFWTLAQLFGGYAQGEVFSKDAARRFGRVGGWLCAYAVSPFLCHLLLTVTDFEIDRNWAHLSSLQALVLGLLVLVVGQVMKIGREIEEDRESFI